MLNESILLLTLLIISSQSSSLWTSLCVIPTSIVLIKMCSSVNYYSGIVFMMYIMVFIGGLMVLLVSMASISFQDQSFYFMKNWFIILSSLILPLCIKGQTTESFFYSNQMVSWSEESMTLILLSIFILLISLIILTKLILTFKGMIRSL